MEDKINDARLSFICNQDWNNMKPDAEGRFCNILEKVGIAFEKKLGLVSKV